MLGCTGTVAVRTGVETVFELHKVEETGLGSNFLRSRRSFFKSPQTSLPPGFPGLRRILCWPEVRNRTYGEYLGRSNSRSGPKCVTCRNCSIPSFRMAGGEKRPARDRGRRRAAVATERRPGSSRAGPKSWPTARPCERPPNQPDELLPTCACLRYHGPS